MHWPRCNVNLEASPSLEWSKTFFAQFLVFKLIEWLVSRAWKHIEHGPASCAPRLPKLHAALGEPKIISLGAELFRQSRHASCWDWGYSDPPKMENLTGAASHGRKVRIGSVWALEASIVQYCQNWCHILVPVGSTTKDLYTKVFNHVESYNLYKRGTSLMSTIRKLEFLGLLWAGCSFLYFISKNSKFKDIEWE